MSRTKLTDAAIAALPTDGERRLELRDSECPGLIVRSSASRKVYALHARFPGGPKNNPTRRVIGECGTISIKAARAIARSWQEQIRRGIDPQAEVKRQKEAERSAREAEERKGELLFSAIAEDYLKRKVARERRARAVERIIRNELLPAWGDKPISSITRRDVIKLVEQIDDQRGAPIYAQAVFGQARTMFNWIINRGLSNLETSPCDRIRVGDLTSRRREPRQRVLSDDELRCFWKASGRMQQPWRQLFRLLALTGCRKIELAGAKRREFDLANNVFTVPPERFKSGVSHRLPLTQQMRDVLAELPKHQHGEYIFSFTKGATPAIVLHEAKRKLDRLMLGYMRALYRMRGEDPNAVKIEQFSPDGERQWSAHDLRRSQRTRLASLEVADVVAEQILGHGRRGLQRVYDQHTYEPQMRRALELWGAELLRIVNPKPPANVTPMRSRARRT